MSPWCEDFSTSSLKEVLESQAANRMWNKELRLRANALVNSRLAKAIDHADYLSNRKLVHEAASECQRRANILELQIMRHAGVAQPRES
jgi:hypothetical protein